MHIPRVQIFRSILLDYKAMLKVDIIKTIISHIVLHSASRSQNNENFHLIISQPVANQIDDFNINISFDPR